MPLRAPLFPLNGPPFSATVAMSDVPAPESVTMPHLTESSDEEEGQLVTPKDLQYLSDMVKCHESILNFSREVLRSGDIQVAQEVEHNQFLLSCAEKAHTEALARYAAQEAHREDPPAPESVVEEEACGQEADAEDGRPLHELRQAYEDFRTATEEKVKALELALLNVGAGKVPCPAPRFSGERGRGKLTAEQWINQFESWLMLKRLSPVDGLCIAELSLEGEAVGTWYHIKQQMAAQGKAVLDWFQFKTAMLGQYSVVAPGHDVRRRLSALKQTASVAAYHDSFRTIMAEAVDHPLMGAEAVFMFKQGLSLRVQNLLALDPKGRQECADLEAIVTIAKELDSAARSVAGADLVVAPQPTKENATWATVVRGKGKRKAVTAPAPQPKRPSAPGQKRVSDELIVRRKTAGACLKCGSATHLMRDCRVGWRADPPTVKK